jgi:hypothetical protein
MDHGYDSRRIGIEDAQHYGVLALLLAVLGNCIADNKKDDGDEKLAEACVARAGPGKGESDQILRKRGKRRGDQ